MHRTIFKITALVSGLALLAACGSDDNDVVFVEPATPIFSKDGRVIQTPTVTPVGFDGEFVDLDSDGFDDRDTDRDGDVDEED